MEGFTMKTCNLCNERPTTKGKARCQKCENMIVREKRKANPDQAKRKPINHEERLAAHAKRIREHEGIE